MTRWLGVCVVLLCGLGLAKIGASGPGTALPGEELYREACAACHGYDGRGADQSVLGFDSPPDFTDCNFATREPDADWLAVAHQGGPVRGFSTAMPAFGGVFSREELMKILGYIRTFCVDDAWPRGELNHPRALVTTKAYPEDEMILEAALKGSTTDHGFAAVYESRVGARGQMEFKVPIAYDDRDPRGHIGNVALGWKQVVRQSLQRGYILTVGGEVAFPTGTGGFVLEPYVTYGKNLPSDAFLQMLVGLEAGPGEEASSLMAHGVLGKTFIAGSWGRAWSPMVEVLHRRKGGRVTIDLVPQFQVTLNQRQHVAMNIGLRIPSSGGLDESPALVMYLLWEWFDGGFLEGW